jgi:hypothetical protein
MSNSKKTGSKLMSSLADSLAKTSAVQGKPKGSSQNAQGCGQRCFDSSEMYGQRGQLLKMYQPLDLKDLLWSYKISARSACMLNGIVYPLVPLVLLTRGTGSGLLPTPTASTNGPGKNPNNPRGIQQGNALATFARLWPTPTARDYKDTAKDWRNLAKYEHKKRLACSVASQEQTSGQLNPTWVEWLMGYPIGWTDLNN